MASYAAPDVGHSEASGIPDLSDISWKASYAGKKNKPINRDNTAEFLEASEMIYKHLVPICVSPKKNWSQISDNIAICLAKDDTWQNSFPENHFRYSRFDWREAALCGDTVDWDDYNSEKEYAKLGLKWTGKDIKWFLFHKAALEQRVFLDHIIPRTWVST